MTVRFVITDIAHEVPVVYRGLLPDPFREDKDVVACGRLGEDGVFVANEVLAKHDEDYMPPEAADAVRRAAQVKEQMVKESAQSVSRRSPSWTTSR